MACTAEQIRQFLSVFDGYTGAYGQFAIKGVNTEKGKAEGKAWTCPGAPPDEVVSAHLNGAGAGLGIVMLREDDTCMFGAIDIDLYKNIDHVAIAATIERHGLPLVLCRSKSGGAHLYLFLKEPTPAFLVQARLSEWCALLGYSNKTEIFPKQTTRASKEDIGNWINLPYYGAARTMRYAIRNGVAISLDEFFAYVEDKRVSMQEMEVPVFDTPEETDPFYEAPPCLVAIHRAGGFSDGTKKNGMFSVLIYLRKRFPDTWEDKAHHYNGLMANLKVDEVNQLIKSLGKKDYSYKCKDSPISTVCQRKACLSKEFGVGGLGPEHMGFNILGVTRYTSPNEPPLWGLEVNGVRIIMSTDEFCSMPLFNKRCVGLGLGVPVQVPAARWVKMLDEMSKGSQEVPLPIDASATGQLWIHIEDYLRNAKGKSMDSLLNGAVYLDNGKVHFTTKALFSYLKAAKVEYKSTQDVCLLLREKGASNKTVAMKKTSRSVWTMPAPDQVIDDKPVDAVPVFAEQDTEF